MRIGNIRNLAMLAIATTTLSSPTAAHTVLDCPLRDAPLSIDSPLLDVMLNPAAKAAANKALGGKLDSLPPTFANTKAPSFSAILTVRTIAAMAHAEEAALPALDSELRSLPVTDGDRASRCARYDEDRPAFDLPRGKRHLLLFEKINGFKDIPGFEAAHAAFLAMASREGWSITVTDRGGAFTPETLRQFDAVIWNNVSGDVLTLSQRKAFESYIEDGGAYIGVHGSAGDPVYFWDWYVDRLLGARFLGHPMNPQFQNARISLGDSTHPIAAHLPSTWMMNDEWYSFKASPRAKGADVVATLDEASYSPVGPFGQSLKMGDHPIAWSRTVGKGRMFYSAIGHRPETYADPRYVTMLTNAVGWAIGTPGSDKP